MRLSRSQQSISRRARWKWVPPKTSARQTGLAVAIALVTTTTQSPLAVQAHQTQISNDIGGTHHIEPNDTPKAGELSQTWFALTQAGGKSIGLADCDCQLELLKEGTDGTVIAQPELRAIAVEGLTDVPAAEVTFPKVGAYRLRLSGKPQGTADFSAFELEFPVTVAAGKDTTPQTTAKAAPEVGSQPASTAPTAPTASGYEKNKQGSILPVATGLAGLALLIGFAIFRAKS